LRFKATALLVSSGTTFIFRRADHAWESKIGAGRSVACGIAASPEVGLNFVESFRLRLSNGFRFACDRLLCNHGV
jgi:hypothetical protein